jgi:hypothetical protein
MTALLIVLVGIAIIVGKDDVAMKLAKALVGLVLVLSFAPGLIMSVDSRLPSAGCRGTGALSEAASVVAIAVLLSGVGLALWKARGLLAKRKEDAARRWASPRDRAAPPPPLPEHDDGSDLP